MVDAYWIKDFGKLFFLLLSIPTFIYYYRAAKTRDGVLLPLCQLGLVLIAASVALEIIHGYSILADALRIAEHLLMLLGVALITAFTVIMGRGR